jgi:hypothetical protein
MSVALRHPVSGRTKILREGWSWGCFLGVGLLGLPLFSRGLALWGAVMVTVNTMALVALVLGFESAKGASALANGIGFATLGLNLFLGFKANDMAIRRYLSLGWEFADRVPARWRAETAGAGIIDRPG